LFLQEQIKDCIIIDESFLISHFARFSNITETSWQGQKKRSFLPAWEWFCAHKYSHAGGTEWDDDAFYLFLKKQKKYLAMARPWANFCFFRINKGHYSQ
jgi:hypothetical protein